MKDLSTERFGGKFNELKPVEMDRCAKEIFIRELGIEPHDLPMDILKKEWLKSHYGVIKKCRKKDPEYLRQQKASKVKFISSTLWDISHSTMSDGSSSEAEEGSQGSHSDDHRSVGAESIQKEQHPSVEESSSSQPESCTALDNQAEQPVIADSDDPCLPLPASSPVASSKTTKKQSLILQYFTKKSDAGHPPTPMTPTMACREQTPELSSQAGIGFTGDPQLYPDSINVNEVPSHGVHPRPAEVADSAGSTTITDETVCNDIETYVDDAVMTEPEPVMESSEPIVCLGRGGPQGMLNKRNDCYLISVLQILPLLNLQVGSCTDLFVLSVIHLLRECHSREGYYDPKEIKRKLSEKHDLFTDDNQHDASEALNCFFQTFSEAGANMNSIIVKTCITVECEYCSRRSQNLETQLQLPLCCDNRTQSLYSCLDEYCSPTTISDYDCGGSDCTKRGVRHTISIISEPEILIINIQRLEYERRSRVGFECPLDGLQLPNKQGS